MRCMALAWALFVALSAAAAAALPPEGSPRRTHNVEIIDRYGDSVVAIFTQAKENTFTSGSGSVIHRDGYILTNDHVVQDRQGVVLIRGQLPLPFRTIGRLWEKDLALLKVESSGPLVVAPLGRSRDLLAGEPVLVGGNPGGRGVVFSSGIVSSPRVMMGTSALAMSNFRDDSRDRFIQFDAASNPGNSGGPVLNAEGQQIGVVVSTILTEQNINFAIPIDRVHRAFHDLLLPEERGNFWAGIELDDASCQVRQVHEGSPAADAGLAPGDTVTAVGDTSVTNGVDFYVALSGHKPKERLGVRFTRKNEAREATLTLAPYPTKAGLPYDGRERGLNYRLYQGRFTKCPDFDKLTPIASGTIARLKLDEIPQLPADDYALLLEGYIEVPRTDVWAVVIGSDDGSRAYVDGALIAANDGPHPLQWSSGRVRLEKGLHPVRIEYFEATGEADLQVLLSRDGLFVGEAPTFYVDKAK